MISFKDLEEIGFMNRLPFFNLYRKYLSDTECIIIDSCYRLRKKDVVEDGEFGFVYFRVTKINLPKQESKIFQKLENALNYANETD